MSIKTGCFIAILAGALFMGAAAAHAQAPSGVLVYPGERMRNLLLFNQGGKIAGEVTDEVLVINGDITLTPTARIGDRVIIIGGRLKQEPGSVIGKGIFDVGAGSATVNLLFAALTGIVLSAIVKFAVSVAAILLLLLAASFWPGLSRRSAGLIQRHPLKTSLLGILGTVALLSLSAALLLSRWGIPLALIFLLAGALLILPGAAGLALLVGDVINGGTGNRIHSPLILAALGSLPLVSLLNFPIMGFLWVLLLVAAGFGAGLQLIWRPSAKV
ncbi:MAG: hypothetical protein M0Z41_02525 [Peptococcaceae bacterium]|jgi:hypothetical protein|nr:hypothetical protein [Peptococcaceae bacterium]